MPGTTFKRCACVDPRSGRPLGATCPRLRSPRHGRWYFRVRLPGDRYPRRRGGFATQGEAAAALADLLRTDDRQVPPPEPDMTVGEWLDFWLSEKRKRSGASAAGKKVRSTTARGYESHIERHLKPT